MKAAKLYIHDTIDQTGTLIGVNKELSKLLIEKDVISNHISELGYTATLVVNKRRANTQEAKWLKDKGAKPVKYPDTATCPGQSRYSPSGVVHTYFDYLGIAAIQVEPPLKEQHIVVIKDLIDNVLQSDDTTPTMRSVTLSDLRNGGRSRYQNFI